MTSDVNSYTLIECLQESQLIITNKVNENLSKEWH